jgi:hypothetical protein
MAHFQTPEENCESDYTKYKDYPEYIHKNRNCLYFMSKPNSARINCTKHGLIYREYCNTDCPQKFIK